MKKLNYVSVVTAAVLCCSSFGLAQRVHAVYGVNDKNQSPFPSDRFMIKDSEQLTGMRINMLKPNCTAQPSECFDTELLNTLDGFNPQPRISIPFDGAIDPNTVSSATVFLVSLGSTTGVAAHSSGNPQPVGINQVVWDPATKTLHVESNDLLDQHTKYLLVVTNGVLDTGGNPVEASPDFAKFLAGCEGELNDRRDYCFELRDGLERGNPTQSQIVAASVFTTESVTAALEAIREQIVAEPQEHANFRLGAGGEKTIFPLEKIAGITWNYQYSTVPGFAPEPVPVDALYVFPGSIGTVAFGSYSSPNYESPYAFIPQVPTKTGKPEVMSTNQVYFVLFLPSGTRPRRGWPVAIFGHGFEDSKQGGPFAVASALASQGIATIAINAVGHGGGPLGTLVVNETTGASVTLPAGGRGVDQNGDGQIGPFEGLFALPPYLTSAFRDGTRQTVIDLMQLTRLLQTGLDVSNDGIPDLDGKHVSYVGQSFGGIYGTVFLAAEPAVKLGVVNVPGGPIVDVARLSPAFEPLEGEILAYHVPSLANLGGISFDANIPLRDQPPVVNTVPGADDVQAYLDVISWVGQSGDPLGFVQHIRKEPLADSQAKAVILQFAKGDETVPNPTTTALIRAGELEDRTTFFRNDLAYELGVGFGANPHTFLTNIGGTPPVADVAVGAQEQIAYFLSSGGTVTIDPDGAGPLFEVPIVLPLPEELYFLP